MTAQQMLLVAVTEVLPRIHRENEGRCFYGSFKGIIDTGGDNNYSHHTVNRLKHSKSVRRRGQHNLDVDTGMNLSGIASQFAMQNRSFAMRN